MSAKVVERYAPTYLSSPLSSPTLIFDLAFRSDVLLEESHRGASVTEHC